LLELVLKVWWKLGLIGEGRIEYLGFLSWSESC